MLAASFMLNEVGVPLDAASETRREFVEIQNFILGRLGTHTASSRNAGKWLIDVTWNIVGAFRNRKQISLNSRMSFVLSRNRLHSSSLVIIYRRFCVDEHSLPLK